MKQLIFLVFLPVFCVAQDLPEKFSHETKVTGMELYLERDSSFALIAGDCGGLVKYKGSFSYNSDTLVLNNTDYEWVFSPAKMYDVNGVLVKEEPVFIYQKWVRNNDELLLSLKYEPELLGPLTKTKYNPSFPR